MMFHLDLLERSGSSPTERFCEPVRIETITAWVEESNRKKRDLEKQAQAELEEYRKKKKLNKPAKQGSLNNFFVKSAAPENEVSQVQKEVSPPVIVPEIREGIRSFKYVSNWE